MNPKPSHNWGPGGRTSTAAWRRLRGQVIIRDGNRCANCGVNGETTRLECDHVINVKRGGDDSLANTQLLCVDCHRTKTAAEARAGIAARKDRLTLPEEPHPGRPGRR